MAVDKTYTLEIVAKGLKEVSNSINKLSKDLVNLEGAQGKVAGRRKEAIKGAKAFSKTEKGVGKLTNNNTKAFSKMAGQMQGSLVPAYATVAANVFALTAAFGALERAADLQILIESSETLATQTGRSLISLAKSMKTITGEAISMKEALTSASIAASAGFDNSTIEELTQVARNASVALGREMTDALNRVFKGAIKAEPELLDELGIILRLDTATRKYATALGVSATSLTTFQKQQAVVNEVIAQGEKKFGRLSEVDPNPYTQLAAAFQDVSAELLTIISLPITGVLSFLTENVAALTAVLILFASSVLKKAFPALGDFSKLVEETSVNLSRSLQNIKNSVRNLELKILPPEARTSVQGMGEFIRAFLRKLEGDYKKAGKTMTKTLKAALEAPIGSAKQLQLTLRSLRTTIQNLKTGGTSAIFNAGDVQRLEKMVKVMETTRTAIKQGQTTINSAQTAWARFFTTIVTGASSAAISVVNFATVATTSLLSTAAAVTAASNPFKGLVLGVSAATKGLKGFAFAAALAGSAIGGFGALLLRAIPIIATLTIAWSILSDIFGGIKTFIFGEDIAKLSEKLETQTDALNSSAAAVANYDKNLKDLPDTIDNINEKLQLQSNVLTETASNFKDINEAISIDDGFGIFSEFLDIFNIGDLDQFKESIEETIEQIEKLGLIEGVDSDLIDLANSFSLSGKEAERLGKNLQKTVENLRDITVSAKEANDAITTGITELNKSISTLQGELPTLGGIEKTFIRIVELSERLRGKGIDEISSVLAEFNTLALKEFGLQDVVKEIDIYNLKVKETSKTIENLENILREIEFVSEDLFGPVARQAERDIEAIEETIEDLRDDLEGTKNIIANNLINPLSIVRTKFKEISDANRGLIKAQSELNLSRLSTNKDLKDRINLLQVTADIQIKAIDLQEKRAKDALQFVRKDTEEIDKKLEIAQKARAKLRVTSFLKRKKLDGEIGKLITERISNLDLELRLESQLDKTRGKSLATAIKLTTGLFTEIDKINKLQALGVEGLEDRYKKVFDALVESLKSAATETVETAEEAEALANSFIKAQESAASLAAFLTRTKLGSVEKVAQETFRLSTRNEDLQLELDLNEKLSNTLSLRVDKEDLLKRAQLQRIQELTKQEVSRLQEKPEDENARKAAEELSIIIDQQNRQLELLDANSAARLAKEANALKANAKLELTLLKEKSKFGSQFNKIDEQSVAIEKLKLSLLGQSKPAIDELVLAQEKLNKEINKMEFANQLKDAAKAMNSLAGATEKFFENLQNPKFNDLTAGLILLQNIGDDIGGKLGNITKSFATLGLAVQNYTEQIKAITADGTLDVQTKALKEQQATLALVANSAGALAGAFDESSKAAKAFILIQQAATITAAANAVAVAAATQPPGSGFASAAAMLSLMASVLGAAGLAFGGGGISGETAEKDFKERLGSDALRDRDLQSNTLIDKLDELVDINSELFGVTRQLQLSIVDLTDIFSRIGSIIFRSLGLTGGDTGVFAGTTTTQNLEFLSDNILTDQFDRFVEFFSFGALDNAVTDFIGGLTGSTEVTQTLIDSGIKFSAILSITEEGLTGFFNELQGVSTILQTTTKEKAFGLSSDTSTVIVDIFEQLPPALAEALNRGLDSTLSVINQLVGAFSNAVGGIDLENLFAGVDAKVFGDEFLSLFELSGEEAGEAIGLFFSSLTNDILDATLPFLQDYTRAGEELADTLVRLASNTIKLSNAFTTIGVNLNELAGLSNIIKSPNFIATTTKTFFSGDIELSERDFDAAKVELTRLLGDFIFEDTARALLDSLRVEIDTTVIRQSVESFKLEIITAWEEELLKQFKDIDEFSEIFQNFSQAIFDESELLTTGIQTATNTVGLGFSQLTETLLSMGRTDLAAILTSIEDPGEALRKFYEEALSTGAFEAITADGVINTVGAELLSTTVRLGGAVFNLQELQQAIADLNEEIDNLNESYRRQIELFGLVGKEADLLSLSFDFEDAIKEAKETGSDLALVETLFGLRRLEIVKEYYDDTEKLIDDAFNNISDSILEASKNFSSWDEVIFQSIKMDKIAKKLSASLGGIDLSIFTIDLTDPSVVDFSSIFSSIVNNIISTGAISEIEEQVDLVEKLREATTDMYSAQLDSLENMQRLAIDIKEFLDDLIISDLSPLTNFEKLTEAQDQFNKNMLDVLSTDPEIAERAQDNLLDSASSLLEQARLFFSIGGEYQAVFNTVVSSLESLDQTLATGQDPIELAIDKLTTETIEKLSLLDSILLELQISNTQVLSDDIITLGNTLLPPLEAITNKLQSLNDQTWAPILAVLSGLNSFASGTSNVDNDQLAFIHKGEAVLTEAQANNLRNGGFTGVANSITSNDNSDIINAINILTQVLAESQGDIVDQNDTAIGVAKDISSSLISTRISGTKGVL